MRLLVDHPLLTGLGVSSALVAAFHFAPSGALSPTGGRAIGLVVFGGLFALLSWFGLDRDDAFWVFLGGVSGCLITFWALR